MGEVFEWILKRTSKPDGSSFNSPPSSDECASDSVPPPLHRLAWLVNISHPVQEALYNPDADFTLFAPDDDALTPPSKKRHHLKQAQAINNPFDAPSVDEASHGESTHLFWDALEAIESMRDCPHMDLWSEGEDDEKERKKKFFLHAVEMVLKYHLSPGSKKIHEILDSSTLPTVLPILPDSNATRFRVRVGPAMPHLSKPGEVVLNFFTKLNVIKHRPILTKNGVIYLVEKVPLLPPLSPLSELFLFPRPFSTLTSALQKTHLDHSLLPRWENKTIPLSIDSSAQSLVPNSALDESLDVVDERVQSVLSSLTGGHGGKLIKPSSPSLRLPTMPSVRLDRQQMHSYFLPSASTSFAMSCPTTSYPMSSGTLIIASALRPGFLQCPVTWMRKPMKPTSSLDESIITHSHPFLAKSMLPSCTWQLY
ncbi:uncharacterized protein PGTG_01557 [Puccinia graminis f. sp. tritici CRL 75-36-700-3]|uniref:Uncharacterized protein n=1 Tax=Puccinia graminis f. sp. tritici (strain CRL 75-36-700-3 / race SCCL) TaxID=418459 RepID=E3JSJ1_PUCGT|nr:uncharacterized protein PGTG_01557 [Puccinia graminis f. sp. tritici CRL 75-36-700-3]EFP74964.2 hypothetical protein PGTG_01557 [Puccinia graminis f. sp. tritici CRL 75-36-700-3]